MRAALLPALTALALTAPAIAQEMPSSFTTGPVIEDFGPAAPVEADLAIPDDMDLKVAFDVSEAAADGKPSRRLESVARFLNMHAAAGIPEDRIHPAVVVHGPAASDLLQPGEGETNPSAPLVAALVEAGVPVYLCGQTAAARDIAKDDLLPGVELALSAMTAHAVLAEEGYSLNPF